MALFCSELDVLAATASKVRLRRTDRSPHSTPRPPRDGVQEGRTRVPLLGRDRSDGLRLWADPRTGRLTSPIHRGGRAQPTLRDRTRPPLPIHLHRTDSVHRLFKLERWRRGEERASLLSRTSSSLSATTAPRSTACGRTSAGRTCGRRSRSQRRMRRRRWIRRRSPRLVSEVDSLWSPFALGETLAFSSC